MHTLWQWELPSIGFPITIFSNMANDLESWEKKTYYFGPHLPLLFEEDWLRPLANMATPTVGESIKVEQSIPGSRWHRCRCTAPAVRCLPWGGSWSCLQRLFWAGSSANPVGLWARRCNMSGPGWWCCPSRSIPQTLSPTRRSTPRTQPPETTEIFSMSELHFALFFFIPPIKKMHSTWQEFLTRNSSNL